MASFDHLQWSAVPEQIGRKNKLAHISCFHRIQHLPWHTRVHAKRIHILTASAPKLVFRDKEKGNFVRLLGGGICCVQWKGPEKYWTKAAVWANYKKQPWSCEQFLFYLIFVLLQYCGWLPSSQWDWIIFSHTNKIVKIQLLTVVRFDCVGISYMGNPVQFHEINSGQPFVGITMVL